MADLYLTPAERYTAALGGFYYGDLPEPGTVYTQLIKDILDGATPDKKPKNILARFIYSLYISDLGDPYPRYELAKLLYWKLHNITPTKSGSILTVAIDGKEDYMTINTDLSRLWYKVLFGSKTDVITEFPYIFNTMHNKLSDWELFGNEEHSGTPTPDNPITPQGTGERTGNLFDFPVYRKDINSPNTKIYSIYLPENTYVLSCEVLTHEGVALGSAGAMYVTFNGTKRYIIPNSNSIDNFVKYSTTFTGEITEVGFVGYNYDSSNPNSYVIIKNIQLNTGSTALPYEPYGYKLSLTVNGTEYPIYLGKVETTRRIKKLVLTGEEIILRDRKREGSWRFFTDKLISAKDSTGICSHFENIGTNGVNNSDNIGFSIFNNAQFGCRCPKSIADTVTDFKAYLAAQYAAGTPVTVWYVLAEPETAIVNEPLMKIGDYADSISRAQTGIDISTVVGQNTLDVLTTVKPSSMRIEYTSADENQSRSKRISLLKSPLKKGLIK